MIYFLREFKEKGVLMNIKMLSKKELLELAYSSSEEKVLALLASFEDMIVRRAVAKNLYTGRNTINKLASDPVLNVSYIAAKHKNCTLNRVFSGSDINHSCVVCQEDERNMDCGRCDLSDCVL